MGAKITEQRQKQVFAWCQGITPRSRTNHEQGNHIFITDMVVTTLIKWSHLVSLTVWQSDVKYLLNGIT